MDRVEKMLAGQSPLVFVQAFTDSLAISFEHLSVFFGEDERNNFPIHPSVTLGGIAIVLPFILKAYRFGLSLSDKNRLCMAFESLIIRHRLIGTRADITSRINDVYEAFSTEASSIAPILNQIERLQTAVDWWSAYWNNDKLLAVLDDEINHKTAKHLL